MEIKIDKKIISVKDLTHAANIAKCSESKNVRIYDSSWDYIIKGERNKAGSLSFTKIPLI